MNLNILFKPQDKLDEEIELKHGLQGQDLIKKKTVAMICEVYETVNLARFFKFWSTDQKPRTKALRKPTMNEEDKEYYNPLLEEYVDIVHFGISIANDLGYHSHAYDDPGHYDLNDLTIGLTNAITLIPIVRTNEHMATVLNLLIRLGYQLGFEEKDVIDAYFEKNKENHARQANNY